MTGVQTCALPISLFYFSLFFPTATHATATHAGGPIGAVYPGCARLGSCRCFPLLQVGVSSKKGAPKTLAVRAKGRRKSFEYDATTGTGTSTVVIDIIDIIDHVSQGRSLAIPHLPCTVRYYVLGAPAPPWVLTLVLAICTQSGAVPDLGLPGKEATTLKATK